MTGVVAEQGHSYSYANPLSDNETLVETKIKPYNR